MEIRRIVTGYDADGKSVVVSDGPAPRTHDFASIPGFSNTVIWATEGLEAPTGAPPDITQTLASLVGGPGGVRFMVVQFPPGSVFESIDHAAAEAEQIEALPGLADRFDPERPGFHSTPTIDFSVLLQGELWLELEEGEDTRVAAGDTIIQNGTPHAWRNRSDGPAVIAAVMIGSEPADSTS